MSPLARLLLAEGHGVSGSDRGHDRGLSPEKFAALKAAGARLYPQDGSGLDQKTVALVVSSAIEETIPDVVAARRLKIPIVKRAEVLARMVNARRGIAVGGTSGKSTVTGMVASILLHAGLDPWVMNGGVMTGLGNALAGGGDLFVSEVDESDGSIALFNPAVSVVTNITLDHKPLAELRPLFRDFLGRASLGAVVNLDDPEAAALKGAHANTATFSLSDPAADLVAENIIPAPDGITFSTGGVKMRLCVPGHHNVSNALAALAAAQLCGVSLERAAEGLAQFRGIARRLETVGTAGGVTVIDDFAHNPDKIRASLSALREFPGRLWIVFQPHGYGPLRMMMTELAGAFHDGLTAEDRLLLLPVHDAGGSADRSVSSADLAAAVPGSKVFGSRDEAAAFLKAHAKAGDRIVVMGARDDTLADYARNLSGLF